MGRTLKIMDKATARTSNNPVKTGADPSRVEDNDEMVTQIIPIRSVDAQQLMSDLSPFRSDEARIIANQAGNSIVITDTQSNIKHLLEIIKAIDSSAEDVTEVEVFTLKNADATETAALLSSFFPDQSNNGGGGAPVRFGGRGGRGGGGFGGGFQGLAAAFGGGGNQGNALSQRVKKRQQVLAVADAGRSRWWLWRPVI